MLTMEQYLQVKPLARSLCSTIWKVPRNLNMVDKIRQDYPDIVAQEKAINTLLLDFTGRDDYDIIRYLSSDIPTFEGFNNLISNG